MLERDGRAAAVEQNPLAPRKPHFPPKAKNVIFMFMEGGPSQIDLFDPKPELQKWHGKPLPPELTKDLRLAFTKPNAAVLASPRVFTPHGQSGTEFSDFIPHIGSCADDLCLVRSMYTDAFNHHPGQLLLFGGSIQVGRPTMGAWVLYGLGSESQNLPGFVVLELGRRHQRRQFQLVQRISAFDLSGRGVSQFGRPRALSLEPSRRHARDAARRSRRAEGSQRRALFADRRHGDRLAHFLLRTRLPHADGGAGAARFLQGNARRRWPCTA